MDVIFQLVGPYFRMKEDVQSSVTEAIHNVTPHRQTALELT
jgi:hypothetical protein